ncbi:MAG: sugar phosphate isomerase/epimerase [Oscillospiraceae bacterium]|nr:sugar phosphate isomerase/epimerase [Oscillospiraceae bacterium]
MRISVSSWSFQQLLAAGKINQLDMIKRAKALGFQAIEYIDIQPMEGLGVRETAELLREESEKCRLPIIAYTVAADFLRAASAEAEALRLYEQVEIAKILGAGILRHDASNGFGAPENATRGFAQALPRLAEGSRLVTEYAAARGIVTTVENHGYFCQDSLRLSALVEAVGHPNFGALVDFGNFLCADENPAQAVGNLAPYTRHVHAKDFHVKSGMADDPGEGWFRSRGGNYLRGAVIGHGEVPLRQCLGILKRAGWDGCVSIEFEGVEDCETALRIGLYNLKKAIQNI